MFRNLLQLFRVKLVFHIMLDIVIKTNCQKATNPSTFKFLFASGINFCMSFWKPTRVDVDDNLSLPQTQIEMRN